MNNSQIKQPLSSLADDLNENQKTMAALLSGTSLVTFAILRRGGLSVPAFLAGVILLIRALQRPVTDLIEQNSSNASSDQTTSRHVSVPHETGVHVVRSVTINRPIEDLYNFWHEPGNLAQVLKYVDSVQMMGENRAHWTIKLPGGATAEFDAERYTDTPNEVISWRSLPDAEIKNAWSIRFRPAPADRGTEVQFTIEFTPPGGPLGRAVANLFGEVPSQYFAQYLREFKQLMETGEKTTNTGPSGRKNEVNQ